MVAKDQAQKRNCVRRNNLLNPYYLEKRIVRHTQQQHDEQESGCLIKKSITWQVLEVLTPNFLGRCIKIIGTLF